jgi:type IV pilus assembly protein PilM
MSLFSKADGYLGVDLGAHGIKLVELRKTKSRPQLWTYGIVKQGLDVHPVEDEPEQQTSDVSQTLSAYMTQEKEEKKKAPSGPIFDTNKVSEYAALLKETVTKARVTSRRATASLPVSQVFHAVVTLPTVDEKELEHHVKAKIKKMLPHPIDEMQVVHQVIPDKAEKKKQFLRVLVTAAPKSLVQFYSAIFSKAGLQLEELETEAFALERSLVGFDLSTTMVIDIGAERTNFFIIDQGLPITHRSIKVGGNRLDSALQARLQVDESLITQMKIDMSRSHVPIPSDVAAPLIDPIVKEIDYSINLFSSQTGNEGKRLEKIVLTGGTALFPPVIQRLKEHFDYAVFVGDPWARVVYQQGLKPLLDDIGPRMAVSIGLALRNIV